MNSIHNVLYTSFYVDKQEKRQEELDFCILKNATSPFIHEFHVVTETKKGEERLLQLQSKYKIQFHILFVQTRPTYNTFFDLMRHHEKPDSIFILANSDITFDWSLFNARSYFESHATTTSKKLCLALSRWEMMPTHVCDQVRLSGHEANVSQDTWIFWRAPPIGIYGNFYMGIPGCDNQIAFNIAKRNYSVLNSCRLIRTYHYHVTNIRNYTEKDRVGNMKTYLLLPDQKVTMPYGLPFQQSKPTFDQTQKQRDDFDALGIQNATNILCFCTDSTYNFVLSYFGNCHRLLDVSSLGSIQATSDMFFIYDMQRVQSASFLKFLQDTMHLDGKQCICMFSNLLEEQAKPFVPELSFFKDTLQKSGPQRISRKISMHSKLTKYKEFQNELVQNLSLQGIHVVNEICDIHVCMDVIFDELVTLSKAFPFVFLYKNRQYMYTVFVSNHNLPDNVHLYESTQDLLDQISCLFSQFENR